jgi:hypothetical protein
MKKSQMLNEEKLIKEGVQVLMDNLGPVETNRFLTLPVTRKVESVRRHRQWQAKLGKKAFFNKVFGPNS